MGWTEFIIGALVLVSPWALGLGDAVIVWTNGALGAILILVSAWRMFVAKRGTDGRDARKQNGAGNA